MAWSHPSVIGRRTQQAVLPHSQNASLWVLGHSRFVIVKHPTLEIERSIHLIHEGALIVNARCISLVKEGYPRQCIRFASILHCSEHHRRTQGTHRGGCVC